MPCAFFGRRGSEIVFSVLAICFERDAFISGEGWRCLMRWGFVLKRMVWSALAAMVFVCVTAAPGFAASFDCGKAGTSIEKAICVDADLSRQDSWLQETYQKLLAISVEPEKLKAEQRAWIKERDRCRGYEPDRTICLSHVYYARRGRLETALFLMHKNGGTPDTESERYPDMWLMRVERLKRDVITREPRMYKLGVDAQRKLGMRGSVEDIFFIDVLPNKKPIEYRLIGFFSGDSILVVPTAINSSKFSNKNGVEVLGDESFVAPSLYADAARTRYRDSIVLSDRTILRSKAYPVWGHLDDGRFIGDSCEPAVRALEYLDVSGRTLWSRYYLIDAGERWSIPCQGFGNPDVMTTAEYDAERALVSTSVNDFAQVVTFPLGDGTLLAVTDAYVIRIRLHDGQFGRAGLGMASIDSGKILSLKKIFKNAYERRHREAYAEFLRCYETAPNMDRIKLISSKCKREYEDPYRDNRLWFRPLNAEIAREFLNSSASKFKKE